MIAEKMKPYVKNNSAIRMMFEEGNRLRAIYGPENVFDFSLGNPSVPAPDCVRQAIIDLVNEEEPTVLHGYMSNAGFEDVRQTIAESLNRRFGTSFAAKNLIMTVGAASGLNVAFKTILNPGEEVIVFAPYFLEYGAYVRNYDGNLVEISPDTTTFQPNLKEFEEKITPKTRAVIVNTPHNPTAAAIGTVLNLKPVLQLQGEKLDAFAKVRGKKQARRTMLKAMKADFEGRFAQFVQNGEMCLQAAYTGNLEEAEEFKREIQEVFPGMEIHMDPLSLSVACHIGYGALAVACSRKVTL